MTTHDAKVVININGDALDMWLVFNYYPGFPATREEPEDAPDFELISLHHGMHDVTQLLGIDAVAESIIDWLHDNPLPGD